MVCRTQEFSMMAMPSARKKWGKPKLSPNGYPVIYRLFTIFSYQPRTWAKISGATMVASDSMMYLGVFTPSLPQVIFSLGTAPE